MQKYESKFVFWGIRILRVLAILVLLTPFIVVKQLTFPFVFPKAIAFQIILEVMLVLWFAIALLDARFRPNWRHPITIGVLLFLAALLITLPFGLDPARSFWSTRIRMMGVFNYLHYGAWFLMLSSIFKSWQDWRWPLTITTVVALSIDIFGVIEPFTRQMNDFRIISLMGNTLYLAAYLIIHFFIALILAVKARLPLWRGFFLGAAGIHLMVIGLTASRSATLAMAIAVVFGLIGLLLLARGQEHRQTRRWTIAALGLVLLAGITVGIMRTPSAAEWSREHLPQQITRVALTKIDLPRVSLWGIALEAFTRYPITGWGLENYVVVLNTYFDPNGPESVLLFPWFDRAHNQILDILVATGVVGLAGYLAIWIGVALALFKAIKKEENFSQRTVLWLLALMFLAHFVQNFFVFDTIPATMMLYFALALSVSLTPITKTTPGKNLQPRVLWFSLVGVALAIMIVSQYFGHYLPATNYWMNARAYNTVTQDRVAALEMFKDSLTPRTYLSPELKSRMFDGIRPWTENASVYSEEMYDLVKFAADEIAIEADLRSYDFRIVVSAANVFVWLARYEPDAILKAEEYAQKSLDLSSGRSEAYEVLGDIAMAKHEYSDALDYFNEALSRAQPTRDRTGFIRMRIVEAYLANGEFTRAFEQLSLIQKEGYPIDRDVRLPIRMAIVAMQQELDEFDLANAIIFVDHVATIFNDHPDVLRAQATIHHVAGEDEIRDQVIQTIAASYPELAHLVQIELGIIDPAEHEMVQ